MNEFNKNHEKEAVSFFRSDKTAILSTISKKYDGYPFGSFVTYVSGWDRTIFLYLSNLADHTKNLKNNQKSCITLLKKNKNGDVQNSARLTLMGNLEEVPKMINEKCKERFQNIFPESKVYAQMHDFNFYQITVNQARWIGGFGKISWLDPKNWMKVPAPGLDSYEECFSSIATLSFLFIGIVFGQQYFSPLIPNNYFSPGASYLAKGGIYSVIYIFCETVLFI